MQLRHRQLFNAIRTEGAILPADLLQRISNRDANLGGLSPEAYHQPAGVKLNEAINQAWNRMLGAWSAFRAAQQKLPPNDPATSITREKWLLPLFAQLDYGRLLPAKSIELGGKSYAVSHAWQHTPIHLVGAGVALDKTTAGVAGAARSSPHSLLQELLNRSDDHLWGFVSNGLRLRILRDNVSLTRQSFVEFDLEAMMESELYADFTMLWLLCHESRVLAEGADTATGRQGDTASNPQSNCWLEKWSKKSQDEGTRALEQLRKGVEEAIKALGRGFLAHPANHALRQRLGSGELDTQDYYRQLLRLVYRLLFLFVAEDRELLFAPEADAKARQRYTRFYSLARLRRLAERRAGTRHADLFHGLRIVMWNLGGDAAGKGCPELGLPVLGSFLFSPEAIGDLIGDGAACEIENFHLLAAVRALAFLRDQHGLRTVDYRNLRSEELGSVYEALLELHPRINIAAREFDLATAGGNERKTTGSYYTPDSLVQCLLDSALDPVVDEAVKQPNAEAAILRLKVCDPACGSGHFLIAAAHRLAKRLAAVRTGDEEPSPDAVRAALRDVIGHCIYGVDANPMAVELCKVSLWMESLEPGKPLSFLEHRIQCGNSLIGATPALIARGIPDEAFKPIEGDDREYCAEYRKQNKKERAGFQHLPFESRLKLGNLAASIAELDAIDDRDIAGVRAKQQHYEDLVKSSGYLYGQFLADAWCAAFVWKKTRAFPYPITEAVFREIEQNPYQHATGHDGGWLEREVKRLREQYQFFHWHLAFPDAFRLESRLQADVPGGEEHPLESGTPYKAGWSGGFDVVLGNPPWDIQEVKDNEYFANSYPEILSVKSAKDKTQVLQKIQDTTPSLWSQYQEYVRTIQGQSHFIANGERFPLSATGRLNLYRLFLENNHTISAKDGYVGVVIPSGFASDSFSQKHFNFLFGKGRIVSLYDFENRNRLFPGVDTRYKFCLLTVAGKEHKVERTDYVFFSLQTDEIRDHYRHVPMSPTEVNLFNPLSGTPPLFRSIRDLEITKKIHREAQIFCDKSIDSGWKVKPSLMFMMNASLKTHRSAEELEELGLKLSGNKYGLDDQLWLPLYEGKMVGMYDHRSASVRFDPTNRVRRNQPVDIDVSEHQNPNFLAMPIFWLCASEVQARCEGVRPSWLLAIKDVTSATNERTVISAILPYVALSDPLPWLSNPKPALSNACLLANLNSVVLDYSARQKVAGLHLRGHYLAQLPVIPPRNLKQAVAWKLGGRQILEAWIGSRSLELTYTAWDLQPFARDCGYTGEPFRWDEARRFLLRSELDAAYFHLYGIVREDVDYILDTFPIVRRKDEARHGEFRTKRVILEIYDEMQRAMETGEAYRTRLSPPPALGWMPPEIELPATTESPRDGASDGGAPLFQLRQEDAQPQPGLFDEVK